MPRFNSLSSSNGALNHVLQRFAAEALHDNEELPFVLTNFVDGANIRMVERRSRARLAPKSLQRLWILEASSGRNFNATKRPSAVSSAL